MSLHTWWVYIAGLGLLDRCGRRIHLDPGVNIVRPTIFQKTPVIRFPVKLLPETVHVRRLAHLFRRRTALTWFRQWPSQSLTKWVGSCWYCLWQLGKRCELHIPDMVPGFPWKPMAFCRLMMAYGLHMFTVTYVYIGLPVYLCLLSKDPWKILRTSSNHIKSNMGSL